MTSISIGILAFNAAASIDETIRSLGRQSIFRGGDSAPYDIEVIVVANGCTDDTEAVAAAALERLPTMARTALRVLGVAGKSNAWNDYVHSCSRGDAAVLVLMDADIEFTGDDVLHELLRTLAADPACAVATDVPQKSYPRGARLGIADRLSRRRSNAMAGGSGICGQLYAARAEVLRRIWLPAHLPVEDGFIAAMIKTDGFTREPVHDVIVCVRHVSHLFRDEPGYARLTRHEARLLVGSVINAWLFTLLWEAGRTGHAGDYVRARNEADEHWVSRICAAERAKRGRWLIPSVLALVRLRPLTQGPALTRLRRAPLAIAATLATVPALLRANVVLGRQGSERFW